MPKPTLEDLSKKVSASVAKLNPDLFGRVGRVGRLVPNLDPKPARALERQAQARSRGQVRHDSRPELCVTLTCQLPSRMDGDNLATACKPLRDAIAAAVGLDDGDSRLRWQYGQTETRGRPGVVVTVEVLP